MQTNRTADDQLMTRYRELPFFEITVLARQMEQLNQALKGVEIEVVGADKYKLKFRPKKPYKVVFQKIGQSLVGNVP